MKNLITFSLFFAFASNCQAQYDDSQISEGIVWSGNCRFEIMGQDFFAPIFNPDGLHGVGYIIDSEYYVYNFRTKAYETTRVIGEHIFTLDTPDAIHRPDTIDVGGYLWRRHPLANLRLWPTSYYPFTKGVINASENDVSAIACGCFIRMGRSKVTLDTIKPKPIARA